MGKKQAGHSFLRTCLSLATHNSFVKQSPRASWSDPTVLCSTASWMTWMAVFTQSSSLRANGLAFALSWASSVALSALLFRSASCAHFFTYKLLACSRAGKSGRIQMRAKILTSWLRSTHTPAASSPSTNLVVSIAKAKHVRHNFPKEKCRNLLIHGFDRIPRLPAALPVLILDALGQLLGIPVAKKHSGSSGAR